MWLFLHDGLRALGTVAFSQNTMCSALRPATAPNRRVNTSRAISIQMLLDAVPISLPISRVCNSRAPTAMRSVGEVGTRARYALFIYIQKQAHVALYRYRQYLHGVTTAVIAAVRG